MENRRKHVPYLGCFVTLRKGHSFKNRTLIIAVVLTCRHFFKKRAHNIHSPAHKSLPASPFHVFVWSELNHINGLSSCSAFITYLFSSQTLRWHEGQPFLRLVNTQPSCRSTFPHEPRRSENTQNKLFIQLTRQIPESSILDLQSTGGKLTAEWEIWRDCDDRWKTAQCHECQQRKDKIIR